MIRRFLAPVIENKKLAAPGHFELTFEAPELAADARPGQFIAVAVETSAQFLRRPFSIYRADAETGACTILFSLYGPTTAALSRHVPGDKIDIIGPLGGRTFAADPDPEVRSILIGGGYGVPPLAFFARTLRAAGQEVILINGARSKEYLVGTDGLEEIGVHLHHATDDGSFGHHGRVTGVLEEFLTNRSQPVHLYTCGPTPMMRAVADRAIAADVPCHVSMETFMPCGIGICMGCGIARREGGYARGCVEGPVFEAREIIW